MSQFRRGWEAAPRRAGRRRGGRPGPSRGPSPTPWARGAPRTPRWSGTPEETDFISDAVWTRKAKGRRGGSRRAASAGLRDAKTTFPAPPRRSTRQRAAALLAVKGGRRGGAHAAAAARLAGKVGEGLCGAPAGVREDAAVAEEDEGRELFEEAGGLGSGGGEDGGGLAVGCVAVGRGGKQQGRAGAHREALGDAVVGRDVDAGDDDPLGAKLVRQGRCGRQAQRARVCRCCQTLQNYGCQASAAAGDRERAARGSSRQYCADAPRPAGGRLRGAHPTSAPPACTRRTLGCKTPRTIRPWSARSRPACRARSSLQIDEAVQGGGRRVGRRQARWERGWRRSLDSLSQCRARID